MKSLFLTTATAALTLIGTSTTTSAADVTGIQGEFYCELVSSPKQKYSWTLNTSFNGVIEGVATTTDEKGTTDIPLSGLYDLVDGTVHAYRIVDVERLRPGRTLKNVESEKQKLLKLKFVKGTKKDWTLNVYDVSSGRLVPTTIPCKEYDPTHKPKN